MSRMLTLATTIDPELGAAAAGLTIWTILWSTAVFLVGCLVLWLIIYTAVRAALTSHRRQQAEDDAFRQGIAAQRGGRGRP